MQDKELMERYIYEVVRRIPREQREETAMEIRELIEDMAESGETMEAVLAKLGDPSEFAKQYRDESNVLIGPEYYSDYIWLLKLILVIAGIGIFISDFLHGLIQGELFVVTISSMLADLITSGISIIGVVTIAFALFERRKVKVELREKKKWSVDDLKVNEVRSRTVQKAVRHSEQFIPMLDKRARISRGDSVVEIVFSVLLLGLFMFAPELFGAYRFEEHKLIGIVPIFNLAQWGHVLPVLMLSLIFGVANAAIRLVNGIYCRTVMISGIICEVLQMILSVILLKVLPLFNPNFVEEVSRQFNLTFSSEHSKWDLLISLGADTITSFLLGFILLCSLLDIVTVVYKTLKYGDMNR